MRSAADFPTARGAQLMATMAKHFAHKITVDIDEDRARMQFGFGEAVVQTTPSGLRLTIDADNAEGLDQGRGVLESHLLRFAHRDNPAPLVWQDA